jgi:hypothetical protein
MFLLGKELWGELGGLVSSAFYVFAPYHAVDIYVRGAMGEFWALAFFPAIFWAIFRLVKKEKRGYILPLALFYGLLLLSHNIMSMAFTPLVVLWSLFSIWFLRAKWRVSLVNLALGGIWGVGLAAFFTLPAILENKFVHTETMLMGYFNYLAHFVPLKKLFLERFWGYGSSGWGQTSGMPFQIGYLHWIIPTISLIWLTFYLLRKKITFRSYFLFSIFYFLFLSATFMVHVRSTPIWQKIKPLEYFQFPWRFLALSIFAASTVAGSLVYLIKQKRTATFLAISLVVGVVAFNFNFFRPEKIIKITDEEKLFSAKGWNKLQTDAIFDYLPKSAKQPPDAPAPEEPEILEGKVGVTYLKKGTDWYQFNTRVLSDSVTIRLPIYDFPGWQVLVDNKKTTINHDNFLGLITFEIPGGNHSISARLANTPIRFLSNLVSLISLLVAAFVSFYHFRPRRS